MKFRVPGLRGGPVRHGRKAEPASRSAALNGDMPVRFAEGGAVPGDRIVGIMTPGEGITIYPIQSPALKAFDDEPERWLDVRWDIDEDEARALSCADRGDRDQRAGYAGPDRPGDRRQRRQHLQHQASSRRPRISR